MNAFGSNVGIFRDWLLLLVLALALPGALSAAPASAKIHHWQMITYPQLDVDDVPHGISVLVKCDWRDGTPYLYFYLLWSGSHEDKIPAAIVDQQKLSARVHLSDGTIVSPAEPPTWGGAGTRGMTWSLDYHFPWSRNALEEAWIELALPKQTYWIELPYGFTRNPSDRLLPDPDHGMPALPAEMQKLPAKDRLVPWLHVEYDLGEIQNHWRASLNLSNPFDAFGEVLLYRDDTGVGKSMYRWDLYEPRTSLEIHWPGGRIRGFKTAIRLHEDGMRRSDEFHFNRDGSGEKGRDWGTVALKVDDKNYEFVVPSSLFKYVHGVTDLAHQERSRLPRTDWP